MIKTKVFGIGLNKTGTSTLAECGKALGYKTYSCSRKLTKDVVVDRNFSNTFSVVDKYDFFEDWPWPLIYKQLDKAYPGSKFILTKRSTPSVWLNSLKKHSMRTKPFQHCRKLAYGYNYPHGHESAFLNFYSEHNAEVREYFKNRSNDLLEVCWESGHGYEELCDFLNRPNINESMPHVNKGDDVVNTCLLYTSDAADE